MSRSTDGRGADRRLLVPWLTPLVVAGCVLDWSAPPGDGGALVPPAPYRTIGGPVELGAEVDAPAADGERFDLTHVATDPDLAQPRPGPDGALAPPTGPQLPLRALGIPCQLADQCFSGHCADGRCCNRPCVASCASCAIPGAEGLCTALPAGVAPRDGKSCPAASSCGFDGSCDGRGSCRHAPAGGACGAASCLGGPNKALRLLAGACDGLGDCAALGQIDCGSYACDPKTRRCNAECTKKKDCAGPIRQPLGTPCAHADACAAGHCVDGVCCETSCVGPCRTCSRSGAEGRCLALPAGSEPTPSTACPDEAATHPCGADGRCDGAGACRVRPAGTPCAPPTCRDGATASALELWTCDGQPTSAACTAHALPCGRYRCMPGAASCFGRCNAGDQCRADARCVAGHCVPAE